MPAKGWQGDGLRVTVKVISGQRNHEILLEMDNALKYTCGCSAWYILGSTNNKKEGEKIQFHRGGKQSA